MASDLYANRLYAAVRKVALQPEGYAQIIRYQTRPDERVNLPLISFRVYGNFDEALVIQAAAGLDSPEQALSERVLTLPSSELLRQLKIAAGGDPGSRNGRA